MTGKEALERLGAERLARGEFIRNDDKVEPYINCIKKDLDQLKKYKKAIALLEKKFVDVGLFIECDDVGEYNFNRDNDEDRLSDFEFEFLKEVLEDE